MLSKSQNVVRVIRSRQKTFIIHQPTLQFTQDSAEIELHHALPIPQSTNTCIYNNPQGLRVMSFCPLFFSPNAVELKEKLSSGKGQEIIKNLERFD